MGHMVYQLLHPLPPILELMTTGPALLSGLWLVSWKAVWSGDCLVGDLRTERTVKDMRRWLCKLEVPGEE